MSDPREYAPDKAARLGLTLVMPKDDELFIDLDSPDAMARFSLLFDDEFTQVYPLASVKFTTSSGGNIHAYVTVPELKPLKMEERLALEAALGGDPLRQMIAVKHHREGYAYPSVFFEKPGTVQRDTLIEK